MYFSENREAESRKPTEGLDTTGNVRLYREMQFSKTYADLIDLIRTNLT